MMIFNVLALSSSYTFSSSFSLQMASRKVQLDRKAGFLDNINTRMTENQQKKTSKSGKSRDKSKVRPAGMFIRPGKVD